MSRTRRRTDYTPWWLKDSHMFDHRKQEPRWQQEKIKRMWLEWFGDNDIVTDHCPPKWFRQKQQKKHRRKQTIALNEFWMDDPVIHHDYKMPYYT